MVVAKIAIKIVYFRTQVITTPNKLTLELELQ